MSKVLEVEIERRLHGFHLEVGFAAQGETVVLFGPSGAGKSMTLQAIAGIVRPDRGRIVAAGRVLYDKETRINLPPQKRRVGYVPQNYAPFPHLSVEENIAFGLKGLAGPERRRRTEEMMALTGLGGLERRRPRELSGGQQQRVALARALAFRPDILLLDEPLAALDTMLRAGLRDELISLKESTGVMMIVVTHDLADAFLLGQRVVVIDRGRVLQGGGREEVFYRPASRRVAELMGTRNILRGEVVGREGGLTVLRWNGTILKALTAAAPPIGSPVNLCIRPTQIIIRRPGEESAGGRGNVLAGLIADEVIGAETYRLFVRLVESTAAYDLEIDLPAYVYFRLGLQERKTIEMWLRPELIHVIPQGDET